MNFGSLEGVGASGGVGAPADKNLGSLLRPHPQPELHPGVQNLRAGGPTPEQFAGQIKKKKFSGI